VIFTEKHYQAQLKKNLVTNIIEERQRLGIQTTDIEEIELWGRPRRELETMLNELRVKA